MMKDANFVLIQGWMRSKLNLKGNDLLVFAIIYGFSQDCEHVYSGGRTYLAEWCGATKDGISKNLKSLVEKDFIRKETEIINNVTFCRYWVNPRIIPTLNCPQI